MKAVSRIGWQCLMVSCFTSLLMFLACGRGLPLSGGGGNPPAALTVLAPGTSATTSFVENSSGSFTPATGSPFSSGVFGAPRVCAANPTTHVLFLGQVTNVVTSYSVDVSMGVPARVVSGNTAGLPSGIALSGSFLYVANADTNNISGFAVGAGGTLSALSGFPFATDGGPGPISASPDGKFLYVASQLLGTIRVLSVDTTTGALASISNGTVALGSNANGFAITPGGNFLIVVDTAHEIRTFSIGLTGLLTEITGSPLATTLAFNQITVHPAGKFAYAVSAFDTNVVLFSVNNGVLAQISSTPVGTSPSGLAIDASGSFLFVANNGSSTLSVFSIDATTGALHAVTGSPFAVPQAPVCVVAMS